MDQCAGGGIQEAQYREGDSDQVDEHGHGDAEPDGLHRGVGKTLQVGNFGNIIIHQGNVCRFHGNITTHTAHGHADAGGCPG